MTTTPIDRVADDLAQEILREPAFRDEMRDLIRAAFAAARKELHDPAPPPTDERRR